MKVFAVLVLFFGISSAGVVQHQRCGGVGTFREMRIRDCEGAVAIMTPGTPYPCEGDIVPSTAAPELRLKVTATYMGTPVPIINTVLPNSSTQPGQPFTVIFTITPNDALSGNTVPVRSEVSNEGSGLVEICVQVQARIL